MKLITLLIAATVLFSCSVNKNNQKSELISMEINSEWKFKQANKEEWLPATVPGTVHADLLNNGKIDDPYYRLNEKKNNGLTKLTGNIKPLLRLGLKLWEKPTFPLILKVSTPMQMFI